MLLYVELQSSSELDLLIIPRIFEYFARRVKILGHIIKYNKKKICFLQRLRLSSLKKKNCRFHYAWITSNKHIMSGMRSINVILT